MKQRRYEIWFECDVCGQESEHATEPTKQYATESAAALAQAAGWAVGRTFAYCVKHYSGARGRKTIWP